MAVTLDAIASSGGTYRGVACVDDRVTDPELRRLHEGGIRGIRFNFVKHLAASPTSTSSIGWSHASSRWDGSRSAFRRRDIITQADLLRRIDVPFIIDHMGRVKAADGLGQRPFSYCWIFTQQPAGLDQGLRLGTRIGGQRPFRDAVPFARALIGVDSQRILWGTDWPHPNITKDMPNDGELVDLFAEICPDPAMRQRILVDNPTRMYWAQ